jgi:hypothetical protein
MALSKDFINRTEGELLNDFLQACDLSNRLFNLYWQLDEDHSDKARRYRIYMKSHKRFMRRSNALVSFQAIKSQELKAIFERMSQRDKLDSKVKVIRGWQHSNLFTLPSSIISVTETGQEIRFSVGGLYSEISYKRQRICKLRKFTYRRIQPVLSKRYFPLPAKYMMQIIPG